MRIKELLTGDDAVSPVIGVILMVAITVILAAVIAAFVLGLGDSGDPAPQVSFDYDYNETATALDVTVEGGDTFDASNANVTVEGSEKELVADGPFSAGETVSAGDSFRINSTASEIDVDVGPGERVDITFTPDEGGESSIIGTFTAPEN